MGGAQETPWGKILRINPETPAWEKIQEAVDVLNSGGVILFPTLSLYGLGADAANPLAIARVFEIKQRPASKPLLVLVRDMDELRALVKTVPGAARKLMDRFWPGNITLVFEARDSVPENLCAGTGKIGIRMPFHPVAKALCRAFGRAITATSANLSGAPGGESLSSMDEAVFHRVDLVLDAGPLAGGPGSTVVDVTVDPPKILREGTVQTESVLETLADIPEKTLHKYHAT
jgi:L-threonylcarbamoyladenylate synthase